MRLDSSQRALVRRAARPADGDPSELGGELNIVPFLDIVTNIIMFLLATTFVALAVAEVPTTLAGVGPTHTPPGLGLSVTLVRGGAIVAAPSGKITTHGWAELDDTLARVKAAHPGETDVIVSADPEVPYEDFIHAMDVARGPSGERFPNVLLSAGVR